MIYIYCTCISNVDSEFIRCTWYILNYIFIISYSMNILRISMIMTLDTHFGASNLPGAQPQSQICQLWRFAAWSLDQSQANCLSARDHTIAPLNLLLEKSWKNLKGKKWIKDDQSRKGCRDFKVPFTKNFYWSRFMSQHMASYKGSGRSSMSLLCLAGTVTNCERKDQQGQTHRRMLNTAKYKQCIDQCKTHVAHTYMLIWKNTMQLHNMSIHQSFGDNIASCWCKFLCFCGPN